MSKIKELNQLFSEWKECHAKEGDDSCQMTFPLYKDKVIDVDKFKNNWTNDGYLNDNSTCRILFILKESNIEELADKEFVIGDSIFWLKENREKYRKAIPRRLKKLTVKLLDIDDSSKWYEYAAMMNINKRGGFRNCKFENLLQYADIYSDKINKQIEILDPEIIVFLGREFFDNRDEVLNMIEQCKGRKVRFHYHPSWKGDKNNFTDTHFLEEIMY